MPYYITDSHPDCSAWATIKEDGELLACHATKQGAIDQMVAVSIAEGMEPGGERAKPGDLRVGDYVSWNSSGGRARGEIQRIVTDGTIDVPNSSVSVTGTPDDPAALIQVYRPVDGGGWEDTDVFVAHKFSTLTRIDELPEPMDEPDDEDDDMDETRQVDLTPPAYMRAAARQGLRYYEEGLGGDGLVARTISEARAMASGSVTADKWVRLRAWIARHLVDLDSPDANPNSDGYPSAGVVAHLLWGSGPSKQAAQRALDYADRIVTRLEEQNRTLTSAKGESMSKIEIRTTPGSFEIREDGNGMTFEGYAAVFNSDSAPLPFIERIAPGAFSRSLKRGRNDIKLLWNHETGEVLGSTRAGTLQLEEDGHGLKVRAILPDTTTGRDAAVLLKRGDIDSMSFGFSVPDGGDEWSSDGRTRTLKSVRLHEVSIVAFPAYAATAGTTSVRGLDKVAARASVDSDQLADAVLKLETGTDLSETDAELLRTVIDELAPAKVAKAPEPATDGDVEMLELMKAKLKLIGDNNGN
jgi:HK97 family phage prohead protease